MVLQIRLLKARRDIGILGLLHWVNWGVTSSQIAALSPIVGLPRRQTSHSLRAFASIHDKQLLDRVSASSTEQFRRSIFGMVQCYNALPQSAVDKPCVRSFQRTLQLRLIARAKEGHPQWQTAFSDGRRYAFVLSFQRSLA